MENNIKIGTAHGYDEMLVCHGTIVTFRSVKHGVIMAEGFYIEIMVC
jgi:hypothetical protein